jgi:hypothetical protein
MFFIPDKTPPQYLREAYVGGAFARIRRDDRGPCEVRLVEEQFPDAQLRDKRVRLDLEIAMALTQDKQMFKEWRELRAKFAQGEFVPAETSEQLQASAREAIPRICEQKAAKYYAGSRRTSLLILVGAGPALSAQEMARLTEPWKDRFEAIYLLCGMDAVIAWPELSVLKGKEPF